MSAKKVKFNLIPQLQIMHTWSFAYRIARKGDWIQKTIDRERFNRRIKNFEKEFEKIRIKDDVLVDSKTSQVLVDSKTSQEMVDIKLQANNILFLDYQYHVGNKNQIFIKELALMRADAKFPVVYYFQPPYSWHELDQKAKKHVRFCEQNINGLLWSSGVDPYIKLSFIIKNINNDETIEKILVKGENKLRFLQNYLDKVEEINMPGRFTDYPLFLSKCEFHLDHFHMCSINHVYQMQKQYLTGE